MLRYELALLVSASLSVAAGAAMVVLNLAGHAPEPTITALCSASGASALLLAGGRFVRPGL